MGRKPRSAVSMKCAAAVSSRSRYLFRRRNFDVVAGQFPTAPFGAMGLTNPVLGFVRIAGIRTIVAPVHAAVPFGTHDLVLFHPCFLSAEKYDWHCWCV